MPGFRWDLKSDIDLCIQVTGLRPKKPAEWDELASNLSLQFSTEKNVQLKGRGCKERFTLLLKKYKEEDTKALKRWCVFVCVSFGVFSS